MVMLIRTLVIAVLATLLYSPAASAQDERTELTAGLEAARSRQWSSALVHFQRAYDTNDRNAILINVAGAQRQTGQLIQAAETYQQFIDDASGTDEQHIPTVRAALTEVQRNIPAITITVAPGSDGDVYIDGEEISNRQLRGPIPLNPGAHQIELRDGRSIVAAQTMRLREGSREAVTLQAVLGAGGLATTTTTSSRRSPWLWVGIGVGAAVVAGTAVALALTLGGSDERYPGNFGSGGISVP